VGIERYSSLSLESVPFSVAAQRNGAVYNPTSAAFSAAFLPEAGNPAPGDWKAGTWETTVIGTYVGIVKIGPGGVVQLSPGEYYAWTKIVDATLGETVIAQTGKIIIY
jgi:hypothetical protein